MKLLKRIWEKLYTPSRALVAIVYPLTAVSAGLALFAVFSGNTTAIWAYLFYALAAVCLFCATVMTVGLLKNSKQILKNIRGRYAFIEKITVDTYYRKVLTNTVGLLFSFVYAAFVGVVAFLGRSAWYGALAAYHFLFGALRAILLKRGTRADSEEEKARSCAMNGWLLIVFSVALAVTVVLQVSVFGQTFRYAGLLVYAFAAYAFYKITVSTVGLCKIGKQNDYLVKALVADGFASASVSILSLQTALLDAFSEVKTSVPLFNGLTGAVVCLIIAALGVICIRLGRKRIKELNNGRE